MAQIYYYDPQSAGINMQSTQSESIPRRLTLAQTEEFMFQNVTYRPTVYKTVGKVLFGQLHGLLMKFL
jgi:hypothetical protein